MASTKEGRPTTLAPRWRKLADAVGGVVELAKACGVNRETIRRWSAGTRPAAVVQAAVNGLAAKHGLPAVFVHGPKEIPPSGTDLTRMVLGTEDDNG